MKDSVKVVDRCRLCESKNLKKVIVLSKNPIGDRFFRDKQKALECELHNVEVMLCEDCGQMQLNNEIEPGEVYVEEYLYTTSTSVGLPEHFKESVKSIISGFNISKGLFIVEVGSNEGIMLEVFKNEGMKVLGVDPSKIAVDKAMSRGIDTLCDFFSSDLSQKIIKQYGRAKIINANYVIANIPDFKDVARGIKELLDEDGVFVFETGYAYSVIQKHLIDTIYHEHISYFTATALARLFESCGLELFDAEEIWTKGGSLRGYVGKPRRFEKTDSLSRILQQEKEFFANKDKIFVNFQKNLEFFRNKIEVLGKEIKERNGKLVVYGASVGGVMMVYHLGLSHLIDCFVDDNVAKIGAFCPNLGVPVLDSKILENGGIKEVISVAWRFMEPITKKHKKFLEDGGKFYSLDLTSLEIKEYGK